MPEPFDLVAIKADCATPAEKMAGWKAHDIARFAFRARTDLLHCVAVIEALQEALMQVLSITAEWPADFTDRDYIQMRQSVRATLGLVRGGGKHD